MLGVGVGGVSNGSFYSVVYRLGCVRLRQFSSSPPFTRGGCRPRDAADRPFRYFREYKVKFSLLGQCEGLCVSQILAGNTVLQLNFDFIFIRLNFEEVFCIMRVNKNILLNLTFLRVLIK